MTETGTLDGYIRVSAVRGRGGASYISPTEQRAAIERWAQYRRIQIAHWHVDEDQSGGTHNRPGLEAAIGRAVAGYSAGIVAAKIDRFSRISELGLRDLRRLQEAGARLVFAVEDIDTAGPLGRLIYTIMLAQAEYFLEQIKAGWIAAKTRAVERGAYISRTPFGYERQDDGTIAPHPIHAEHVAEAFRRAAADGVPAAAAYLQDRAPVRTWTTATVRRLLARRAYLGETNSGRFTGVTHDPLVSPAIWDLAQHDPGRRVASADFPLSGVLRCGNCKQPMIGGHGGKGSQTRIYRCSATSTGHRPKGVERCEHGVVITAAIAEEHVKAAAGAVLGQLRMRIGDPDADALVMFERAVGDAEAELDAFAGDMTMRRALGERYHDHLAARVQAVEHARGAYRDRARDAATVLQLSADDVLDDPVLLPMLLGRMFTPIVVAPGRGHVRERIRLLPFDGDGTAWVLGAEVAQ